MSDKFTFILITTVVTVTVAVLVAILISIGRKVFAAKYYNPFKPHIVYCGDELYRIRRVVFTVQNLPFLFQTQFLCRSFWVQQDNNKYYAASSTFSELEEAKDVLQECNRRVSWTHVNV